MINQSKPGRTKLNGIWETRYLKDLNRIDGEPMEFEWKMFPGFTTFGVLEEIQTFMTELQSELEQPKDHLHVDVQRHCMVRTRKHRKVFKNYASQNQTEIGTELPNEW